MFHIDVNQAYLNSDFTIYLSLNTHQEPNHLNRDREVYRIKRFKYQAPKFAKRFDKEAIIYMSVFSEVGTSFKLRVTNPSHDNPEDDLKLVGMPSAVGSLPTEGFEY